MTLYEGKFDRSDLVLPHLWECYGPAGGYKGQKIAESEEKPVVKTYAWVVVGQEDISYKQVWFQSCQSRSMLQYVIQLGFDLVFLILT